MKNSLFLILLSLTLFPSCDSNRTEKTSSTTHRIQEIQQDFHEEEASVAYDEVKTMMAHAIEFRETNVERAASLMADAIKKMERSKLRSYELRADMHNALGTILQRQHNYAEALAAYDRALHLYDSAKLIPAGLEKRKTLIAKLAAAQVNNGIAEMHTHDYYHAKIGFDQVASDPEVDDQQKAYALQMKASVLRKEIRHMQPLDHQIQEIWNAYKGALKISRDKHDVLKNIGDYLAEQGAYLEADSIYDELLEITKHDDPRKRKNEEADIHFRKCKNIITNYEQHKDHTQMAEVLRVLEQDVNNKYYDTHYLQADIQYLMALGYFHIGKKDLMKKHLALSTKHNAKHVNAMARNALLKSHIDTSDAMINELYRYASLANENWKFNIEKRLVELLNKKGRKEEADTIERNLLEEHHIHLENIGFKNPERVLALWKS